jgi:exonuclease III
MTVSLKIASMNVQGIGDKQKRKDVFNYLTNKKYNIYFLQDTHFVDKDFKYIRSQWGYECFINNFNSQSRGVAILINNNFDFKLVGIDRDNNGNLIIIVHRKINGRDFFLFNIYGPN